MHLSICLPSNRSLVDARQSIESGLALAQLDGVELAISDNSGDDRKESFCRQMVSSSVRYLRADGTDASTNGRNAMHLSTGEYISFLADDDLFIALPGASLSEVSIPPDAVGFRPQMVMFTKNHGLYNLSNFSVSGLRAVDRIKDYFMKNGGANITLYSAYRRDIIGDLIELIFRYHPTRGGYSDWAFVLGLLSTGGVIAHAGLVYIYNNSNWNNWLSAEQIQRNIENTFTNAGLPGRTAILLLLLLGIDSFILIARESSPIDRDEKLEAATYALLTYLHAFTRNLESAMSAPETSAAQVTALNNLAANLSSPADALRSGFRVVERYLPGYEEKYISYFRRVVGREMFPSI